MLEIVLFNKDMPLILFLEKRLLLAGIYKKKKKKSVRGRQLVGKLEVNTFKYGQVAGD